MRLLHPSFSLSFSCFLYEFLYPVLLACCRSYTSSSLSEILQVRLFPLTQQWDSSSRIKNCSSRMTFGDQSVERNNNSKEEVEPNMKGEESVVRYKSSNVKMARLQSMLSVFLNDPILADVPKKPTLADVDTLLNFELGSAMRISIVKMDNIIFDVAVLNSATVKELKLAIKRKTNDMEQSQLGQRHISWRHIWSNFCLSYNNEKLIHENALLQNFGIRNSSQVHFVPFIMSRVFLKHTRRRKHQFFHGLRK